MVIHGDVVVTRMDYLRHDPSVLDAHSRLVFLTTLASFIGLVSVSHLDVTRRGDGRNVTSSAWGVNTRHSKHQSAIRFCGPRLSLSWRGRPGSSADALCRDYRIKIHTGEREHVFSLFTLK